MNIYQTTKSYYVMTVVIAFLLTTSIYAENNKGVLIVEVNGFQSSNGRAMIALYDSKDKFDNEINAFREAQLLIHESRVVWTVNDLPSGEYAIKMYYDENNNGIMDTNLLGIPKEGFGFSNNAEVGSSPPSFEKTMFKIKDGVVKQTIQLTYM